MGVAFNFYFGLVLLGAAAGSLCAGQWIDEPGKFRRAFLATGLALAAVFCFVFYRLRPPAPAVVPLAPVEQQGDIFDRLAR